MEEDNKSMEALVDSLNAEVNGIDKKIIEVTDFNYGDLVVVRSHDQRYVGIVISNQNDMLTMETPTPGTFLSRLTFEDIESPQRLYIPKNESEILAIRNLILQTYKSNRFVKNTTITQDRSNDDFYVAYCEWYQKKNKSPYSDPEKPSFWQRLLGK